MQQETNPSGVIKAAHDIRVENLPLPLAEPGSVVIKVAKAGICGSDLHFYHAPGTNILDKVLGHEFTGTIVEQGAGVTDLPVGTRVVVNPMLGLTGLGGSAGGFANFIRVNEAQRGHNVLPIPDSLTDEQGALIEPLTVGWAAAQAAALQPADTALVTGAGPIGLAVVACLKALGIKTIVVSDISDKRLEVARQLGADLTFNPGTDGELGEFLTQQLGRARHPQFQNEVSALTVAFECTGVTPVLAQLVENLTVGGRLILVAGYGKKVELEPNTILLNALTIKGSLAYSSEQMAQAIDLVAAGRVDLSPIISHQYLLQDLPQAFATQANSAASIKVLVTPNAHA